MSLLVVSSIVSAAASFWSGGACPLPCRQRHRQHIVTMGEASKWATPEELLGPWELRTSISGFEETWFELNEDGSVTLSAKAGQGKSWRAESVVSRPAELDDWMLLQSSPAERLELEQALSTQRSGWRLHVGLSDKMGWPLQIVGEVREDEYTGFSVAGRVLSTPKRAKPGAAAKPVAVGEFKCFKVKE